jgi:hypothetical protein
MCNNAGGLVLHPTIHFLNKIIKITMKVKCGARISLEDKKYRRESSLMLNDSLTFIFHWTSVRWQFILILFYEFKFNYQNPVLVYFVFIGPLFLFSNLCTEYIIFIVFYTIFRKQKVMWNIDNYISKFRMK